MISADRLADYVDAADGDDYVSEVLDEAEALVSGYIGEAAAPTIPDLVRDRAVLEAAAALYHRRQTKLGIIGLGNLDGQAQPVRTARDPLNAVRPILGPYIWGIG